MYTKNVYSIGLKKKSINIGFYIYTRVTYNNIGRERKNLFLNVVENDASIVSYIRGFLFFFFFFNSLARPEFRGI